jgi:DNA-binding beta-propeller fold protein YncE
MRKITLLALSTLFAAATAPGSILVSQFDGDSVLSYSTNGTFQSTLVSPGAGGLDLPHRSRLAPDGTLVIASAGTDNILRFDAATGAFLGEFISASAGLDYPVDMVFRHDGFVYVSSQLSDQILRFDSTTGLRDLSWSASHASLSGPSGLAFDLSGNLYVSGRFSNNVVRFASDGSFSLAFGSVSSAFGLAFQTADSLLVASGAGSIQRFSNLSSSPVQTTWASGLNIPVGLEPVGDGTFLVAQYGATSLSQFNSDGTLLANLATGSPLNGPNFVTIIPEPSASMLALLSLLFVAIARRPRRNLLAGSGR